MTGPVDPRFPDEMTLADARDVLRPLAAGDGAPCPVCRQTVKIRRRNLTGVAAQAVRALYLAHGLDYGQMKEVVLEAMPAAANQGGYLVLAQHWSLIEEERTVRRDDGGRAGWWRVTPLGEQWLCGETSVAKYADIYNGRCLGLLGDLVTYADVTGDGALGARFDYGEVLRRRASGANQESLFAPAQPMNLHARRRAA